MADKTEKKECKGCHQPKPLKDFVKSKVAKSGRLGYCYECWSGMVSHKKGGPKKHKPKIKGKHRATKNSKLVDIANDALAAANKGKEQFLVRADDQEVIVFKNEQKALRQAMEWKMKGHAVSVWRQCEFEMVLRIIG